MKRFVIAAAAALIATVAAPARAQTTKQWTFTTVDAVQVNSTTYAQLTIRGVLLGDPGPTDHVVNFYSSTTAQFEVCQRLALLAMSKPGQYVLFVDTTINQYPLCKLSRAAL